MAELSASAQRAIRVMAAGLPEAILQKLSVALRSPHDARLDWIRAEVVGEIALRRFRAQVLGPLTPMFSPRADGVRARTFPKTALLSLWTALEARQPELLARARASSVGGGPVDGRIADQITAAAANLLRDESATVAPGLDAEGAREMAACFDLAPVTRAAIGGLRDWTGRPAPESVAALRLLYSDAARVSPDAAPRLTEILFANIAEAPLILRVIGRISDYGGDERFLAESELADFGERLFEPIERAAAAVRAISISRATPEEVRQAMSLATSAAEAMSQMDLSLGLSVEGAWGARFQGLKLALGEALNDHLGRCEKAVDKALPMERVRVAGSMTRMAPSLDSVAEGPLVDQARRCMLVLAGSRNAAAVFGCGGRHASISEALARRLSAYGDELVEALNAGDGDARTLGALVELCAEFLVHADAESEARALRRRLAVARPMARAG